jgi:hypothetical protein
VTRGANNLYDPENAWTDASEALDMQTKKKSDSGRVQKYS